MAERVKARLGTVEEQVAVVTGASSGFGMLIALQLARLGWRVIATMRDMERATELRERAEREKLDKHIDLMKLDVTDHEASATAVAETIRLYGRIDALVNNAGIAVGGFIEEISMDKWRHQMEANFFGVVALTQQVIPVMRGQQEGLIINMSSVSGRVGFPGYAPYAASKFALEGFSESLRHELLPFGIKVVLVEPGAYRTPIWGKGLQQMSGAPDSPYKRRLDAIAGYSRRTGESAPDPQQIARFIGRLVRRRSPRLRYLLGRGSRLSVWGRAILPWKWFERLIERGTR